MAFVLSHLIWLLSLPLLAVAQNCDENCTGTIVGVAIGCVLGTLVIVGIAILLFMLYRKRVKARRDHQTTLGTIANPNVVPDIQHTQNSNIEQECTAYQVFMSSLNSQDMEGTAVMENEYAKVIEDEPDGMNPEIARPTFNPNYDVGPIKKCKTLKVLLNENLTETSLGLNIAGSQQHGIFINKVTSGGAAEQSGVVEKGDKIRSVTVHFDKIAYEDALTILSYAARYKVGMELEREFGQAKLSLEDPMVAKSQFPQTLMLPKDILSFSHTEDDFDLQKHSSLPNVVSVGEDTNEQNLERGNSLPRDFQTSESKHQRGDSIDSGAVLSDNAISPSPHEQIIDKKNNQIPHDDYTIDADDSIFDYDVPDSDYDVNPGLQEAHTSDDDVSQASDGPDTTYVTLSQENEQSYIVAEHISYVDNSVTHKKIRTTSSSSSDSSLCDHEVKLMEINNHHGNELHGISSMHLSEKIDVIETHGDNVILAASDDVDFVSEIDDALQEKQMFELQQAELKEEGDPAVISIKRKDSSSSSSSSNSSSSSLASDKVKNDVSQTFDTPSAELTKTAQMIQVESQSPMIGTVHINNDDNMGSDKRENIVIETYDGEKTEETTLSITTTITRKYSSGSSRSSDPAYVVMGEIDNLATNEMIVTSDHVHNTSQTNECTNAGVNIIDVTRHESENGTVKEIEKKSRSSSTASNNSDNDEFVSRVNIELETRHSRSFSSSSSSSTSCDENSHVAGSYDINPLLDDNIPDKCDHSSMVTILAVRKTPEFEEPVSDVLTEDAVKQNDSSCSTATARFDDVATEMYVSTVNVEEPDDSKVTNETSHTIHTSVSINSENSKLLTPAQSNITVSNAEFTELSIKCDVEQPDINTNGSHHDSMNERNEYTVSEISHNVPIERSQISEAPVEGPELRIETVSSTSRREQISEKDITDAADTKAGKRKSFKLFGKKNKESKQTKENKDQSKEKTGPKHFFKKKHKEHNTVNLAVVDASLKDETEFKDSENTYPKKSKAKKKSDRKKTPVTLSHEDDLGIAADETDAQPVIADGDIQSTEQLNTLIPVYSAEEERHDTFEARKYASPEAAIKKSTFNEESEKEQERKEDTEHLEIKQELHLVTTSEKNTEQTLLPIIADVKHISDLSSSSSSSSSSSDESDQNDNFSFENQSAELHNIEQTPVKETITAVYINPDDTSFNLEQQLVKLQGDADKQVVEKETLGADNVSFSSSSETDSDSLNALAESKDELVPRTPINESVEKTGKTDFNGLDNFWNAINKLESSSTSIESEDVADSQVVRTDIISDNCSAEKHNITVDLNLETNVPTQLQTYDTKSEIIKIENCSSSPKEENECCYTIEHEHQKEQIISISMPKYVIKKEVCDTKHVIVDDIKSSFSPATELGTTEEKVKVEMDEKADANLIMSSQVILGEIISTKHITCSTNTETKETHPGNVAIVEEKIEIFDSPKDMMTTEKVTPTSVLENTNDDNSTANNEALGSSAIPISTQIDISDGESETKEKEHVKKSQFNPFRRKKKDYQIKPPTGGTKDSVIAEPNIIVVKDQDPSTDIKMMGKKVKKGHKKKLSRDISNELNKNEEECNKEHDANGKKGKKGKKGHEKQHSRDVASEELKLEAVKKESFLKQNVDEQPQLKASTNSDIPPQHKDDVKHMEAFYIESGKKIKKERKGHRKKKSRDISSDEVKEYDITLNVVQHEKDATPMYQESKEVEQSGKKEKGLFKFFKIEHSKCGKYEKSDDVEKINKDYHVKSVEGHDGLVVETDISCDQVNNETVHDGLATANKHKLGTQQDTMDDSVLPIPMPENMSLQICNTNDNVYAIDERIQIQMQEKDEPYQDKSNSSVRIEKDVEHLNNMQIDSCDRNPSETLEARNIEKHATNVGMFGILKKDTEESELQTEMMVDENHHNDHVVSISLDEKPGFLPDKTVHKSTEIHVADSIDQGELPFNASANEEGVLDTKNNMKYPDSKLSNSKSLTDAECNEDDDRDKTVDVELDISSKVDGNEEVIENESQLISPTLIKDDTKANQDITTKVHQPNEKKNVVYGGLQPNTGSTELNYEVSDIPCKGEYNIQKQSKLHVEYVADNGDEEEIEKQQHASSDNDKDKTGSVMKDKWDVVRRFFKRKRKDKKEHKIKSSDSTSTEHTDHDEEDFDDSHTSLHTDTSSLSIEEDHKDIIIRRKEGRKGLKSFFSKRKSKEFTLGEVTIDGDQDAEEFKEVDVTLQIETKPPEVESQYANDALNPDTSDMTDIPLSSSTNKNTPLPEGKSDGTDVFDEREVEMTITAITPISEVDMKTEVLSEDYNHSMSKDKEIKKESRTGLKSFFAKRKSKEFPLGEVTSDVNREEVFKEVDVNPEIETEPSLEVRDQSECSSINLEVSDLTEFQPSSTNNKADLPGENIEVKLITKETAVPKMCEAQIQTGVTLDLNDSKTKNKKEKKKEKKKGFKNPFGKQKSYDFKLDHEDQVDVIVETIRPSGLIEHSIHTSDNLDDTDHALTQQSSSQEASFTVENVHEMDVSEDVLSEDKVVKDIITDEAVTEICEAQADLVPEHDVKEKKKELRKGKKGLKSLFAKRKSKDFTLDAEKIHVDHDNDFKIIETIPNLEMNQSENSSLNHEIVGETDVHLETTIKDESTEKTLSPKTHDDNRLAEVIPENPKDNKTKKKVSKKDGRKSLHNIFAKRKSKDLDKCLKEVGVNSEMERISSLEAADQSETGPLNHNVTIQVDVPLHSSSNIMDVTDEKETASDVLEGKQSNDQKLEPEMLNVSKQLEVSPDESLHQNEEVTMLDPTQQGNYFLVEAGGTGNILQGDVSPVVSVISPDIAVDNSSKENITSDITKLNKNSQDGTDNKDDEASTSESIDSNVPKFVDVTSIVKFNSYVHATDIEEGGTAHECSKADTDESSQIGKMTVKSRMNTEETCVQVIRTETDDVEDSIKKISLYVPILCHTEHNEGSNSLLLLERKSEQEHSAPKQADDLTPSTIQLEQMTLDNTDAETVGQFTTVDDEFVISNEFHESIYNNPSTGSLLISNMPELLVTTERDGLSGTLESNEKSVAAEQSDKLQSSGWNVAAEQSDKLQSSEGSVAVVLSDTIESCEESVATKLSDPIESSGDGLPAEQSDKLKSSEENVLVVLSNTLESIAESVAVVLSDTLESSEESVAAELLDTLESSGDSAAAEQTDKLEPSGRNLTVGFSDTIESMEEAVDVEQSDELESSGGSVAVVLSDTIESSGDSVAAGLFDTLESSEGSVAVLLPDTIESCGDSVAAELTDLLESSGGCISVGLTGTLESSGGSVTAELPDNLESSGSNVAAELVDTLESSGDGVSAEQSSKLESGEGNVPVVLFNTSESRVGLTFGVPDTIESNEENCSEMNPMVGSSSHDITIKDEDINREIQVNADVTTEPSTTSNNGGLNKVQLNTDGDDREDTMQMELELTHYSELSMENTKQMYPSSSEEAATEYLDNASQISTLVATADAKVQIAVIETQNIEASSMIEYADDIDGIQYIVDDKKVEHNAVVEVLKTDDSEADLPQIGNIYHIDMHESLQELNFLPDSASPIASSSSSSISSDSTLIAIERGTVGRTGDFQDLEFDDNQPPPVPTCSPPESDSEEIDMEPTTRPENPNDICENENVQNDYGSLNTAFETQIKSETEIISPVPPPLHFQDEFQEQQHKLESGSSEEDDAQLDIGTNETKMPVETTQEDITRSSEIIKTEIEYQRMTTVMEFSVNDKSVNAEWNPTTEAQQEIHSVIGQPCLLQVTIPQSDGRCETSVEQTQVASVSMMTEKNVYEIQDFKENITLPTVEIENDVPSTHEEHISSNVTEGDVVHHGYTVQSLTLEHTAVESTVVEYIEYNQNNNARHTIVSGHKGSYDITPVEENTDDALSTSSSTEKSEYSKKKDKDWKGFKLFKKKKPETLSKSKKQEEKEETNIHDGATVMGQETDIAFTDDNVVVQHDCGVEDGEFITDVSVDGDENQNKENDKSATQTSKDQQIDYDIQCTEELLSVAKTGIDTKQSKKKGGTLSKLFKRKSHTRDGFEDGEEKDKGKKKELQDEKKKKKLKTEKKGKKNEVPISDYLFSLQPFDEKSIEMTHTMTAEKLTEESPVTPHTKNISPRLRPSTKKKRAPLPPAAVTKKPTAAVMYKEKADQQTQPSTQATGIPIGITENDSVTKCLTLDSSASKEEEEKKTHDVSTMKTRKRAPPPPPPPALSSSPSTISDEESTVIAPVEIKNEEMDNNHIQELELSGSSDNYNTNCMQIENEDTHDGNACDSSQLFDAFAMDISTISKVVHEMPLPEGMPPPKPKRSSLDLVNYNPGDFKKSDPFFASPITSQELLTSPNATNMEGDVTAVSIANQPEESGQIQMEEVLETVAAVTVNYSTDDQQNNTGIIEDTVQEHPNQPTEAKERGHTVDLGHTNETETDMNKNMEWADVKRRPSAAQKRRPRPVSMDESFAPSQKYSDVRMRTKTILAGLNSNHKDKEANRRHTIHGDNLVKDDNKRTFMYVDTETTHGNGGKHSFKRNEKKSDPSIFQDYENLIASANKALSRVHSDQEMSCTDLDSACNNRLETEKLSDDRAQENLNLTEGPNSSNSENGKKMYKAQSVVSVAPLSRHDKERHRPDDDSVVSLSFAAAPIEVGERATSPITNEHQSVDIPSVVGLSKVKIRLRSPTRLKRRKREEETKTQPVTSKKEEWVPSWNTKERTKEHDDDEMIMVHAKPIFIEESPELLESTLANAATSEISQPPPLQNPSAEYDQPLKEQFWKMAPIELQELIQEQQRKMEDLQDQMNRFQSSSSTTEQYPVPMSMYGSTVHSSQPQMYLNSAGHIIHSPQPVYTMQPTISVQGVVPIQVMTPQVPMQTVEMHPSFTAIHMQGQIPESLSRQTNRKDL
uniref:Uncharacterized protein LOC100370151 n=1 Tax=Saccoglossus kowalevskii TaxID=10224 RepID=A0ABM0GKR6_SACKO|nr:PREDICTED: uncharacterized protein LOC100370151 [Saccoglossus kowalevskii]